MNKAFYFTLLTTALISANSVSAKNNNNVRIHELNTQNASGQFDYIGSVANSNINVNVDVTAECRKNGYRVHKIGEHSYGSDRAVVTRNNLNLRSNTSSVVFRDDDLPDKLLKCLLSNSREASNFMINVPMELHVSAQCKKVKRPNKGKVETVKTSIRQNVLMSCRETANFISRQYRDSQ